MNPGQSPETSFGGVPLSSYVQEHAEWTLGDFQGRLRGPFLLVKVGDAEPWVVNLGEQPELYQVEFGRGSSCHVTIDEETISRRHGMLEFDGETWSYIDLGSSNGSFTTRTLQAYMPLAMASGDVVILGRRSRLTFYEVDDFYVFLYPGLRTQRGDGEGKEETRTGTRRAKMFETRATKRMSRMSRRVRPQLMLDQQKGKARSVSRLIGEMSSSSFEDFASFFPHPVLVLLAVSDEPEQPLKDSSLSEIKEEKIDLKDQEFWILASSADPRCVFVGRAPNNDVVLNKDTISRRHAQFRNEETEGGELQWHVTNLSDRAGVWVNGELIEGEAPLGDSVVLRLGQGNKFQFMTPRAFFEFIRLFQEYPYLNH